MAAVGCVNWRLNAGGLLLCTLGVLWITGALSLCWSRRPKVLYKVGQHRNACTRHSQQPRPRVERVPLRTVSG